MHVVHVVNSLETGGAQTLIEGLSSELRGKGVKTSVIVLLNEDTLSARMQVHADVYYLRLPKSFVAFPLGLARLRRLVRTLQPDIIHSHLLQSDLLSSAVGFKGPWISTIHTSGGHERNRGARLVTRVVASRLSRARSVIACSTTAADFSLESLGVRPAAVILNGTKSRESTRRRLDTRPVILSLARWDPMKDHENLFLAVSLLTDVDPRLVCAGADVALENVDLAETLSRSAPDASVDLLGSVSDVGPLLEAADCLVIASAYGEALPMAGIEALASGVPVVTTDVGDCSLLAISTELVVPPKDPAALAQAIRTVLSRTHAEPADVSREARDLYQSRFTIESAAKSYLEVYEAAMHEARA